LPTLIQSQITGVYAKSLTRVWQLGIVFSAVSSCSFSLERETLLRTELETEFGLEKKKAADIELAKKGETGTVRVRASMVLHRYLKRTAKV